MIIETHCISGKKISRGNKIGTAGWRVGTKWQNAEYGPSKRGGICYGEGGTSRRKRVRSKRGWRKKKKGRQCGLGLKMAAEGACWETDFVLRNGHFPGTEERGKSLPSS